MAWNLRRESTQRSLIRGSYINNKNNLHVGIYSVSIRVPGKSQVLSRLADCGNEWIDRWMEESIVQEPDWGRSLIWVDRWTNWFTVWPVMFERLVKPQTSGLMWILAVSLTLNRPTKLNMDKLDSSSRDRKRDEIAENYRDARSRSSFSSNIELNLKAFWEI